MERKLTNGNSRKRSDKRPKQAEPLSIVDVLDNNGRRKSIIV